MIHHHLRMHGTGVFLLTLLLLFLFHLLLLGSMNRLCLWKGNLGREHTRDANHDENVFLHIDFKLISLWRQPYRLQSRSGFQPLSVRQAARCRFYMAEAAARPR